MNDNTNNNNSLLQTQLPPESRGSVPPNSKYQGSSQPEQRAKSVSKEPPVSRDNSQKSNGSSSSTSVFAPSRFFSLSRRIAKIRFSSSSQPPPQQGKSSLTAKSASNLNEEQELLASSSNGTNLLNGNKKSNKMAQSQLLVPTVSIDSNDSQPSVAMVDDKKGGKNLRERALSPSKILRSLRPRSPFGRTNRNLKANSMTPTTTTMISGTSGDISGKNKSFTVGLVTSVDQQQADSSKNQLMSASYHSASMNMDEERGGGLISRFTRANTAQPSDRKLLDAGSNNASTSEKLRSLSCEFIDNHASSSNSKALKQLNETLDEYDESDNSNITASSYSNAAPSRSKPAPQQQQQHQQQRPPPQKLNLVGFGSLNKVEMLRKNFMEHSSNWQQSTGSTEIIKTVKFKEPVEKVSPEANDVDANDLDQDILPGHDQNEGKSAGSGGLNLRRFNVKFGASSELNKGAKGSSVNSLDKPPKGPATSTGSPQTQAAAGNASAMSTFSFRGKFSSSGKSKTIDFPDLLQSAMESNNNNNNNNSSKSTMLTASGRPIQSILRRSETPPTTKSTMSGAIGSVAGPGAGSLRQTSLDLAEQSARETSIEKLLKTTSTSRPLIFNS